MEIARVYWDETEHDLVVLISPAHTRQILETIAEALDSIYSDGGTVTPLRIHKATSEAISQLANGGAAQPESKPEGGEGDATSVVKTDPEEAAPEVEPTTAIGEKPAARPSSRNRLFGGS